MAASLLRAEIQVFSEKYDLHGFIRDYGVVTKLSFTWNGTDVVMGIHRNPLTNDSWEDIGRTLMESYVENLNPPGRKMHLHHWYVSMETTGSGDSCPIGHGIVTGHKKIPDAYMDHTSVVRSITVDEENGEAVIVTRNSVYHCPLEYCRFNKQDLYPDLVPDYEGMKSRWKGKIRYPEIEPGKVLLVLANYERYYFHSLCYIPEDSADGKALDYSGSAHTGTFQDSYLVITENYRVDLRYYPHFGNIEFCSECTDGCPLYLENAGDSMLYAQTSAGVIKLLPGERKEVTQENAETEKITLPGGDLYPAGIIDGLPEGLRLFEPKLGDDDNKAFDY